MNILLLWATFFIGDPCTHVFDKTRDRYYAVYTDRPASFPGGLNKLQLFILNHIDERYLQTKASYTMEFLVDKDGKIIKPLIIGGEYSPKADAMMVKVLMAMPKWNPAKCGEKCVVSKFYYRIVF